MIIHFIRSRNIALSYLMSKLWFKPLRFIIQSYQRLISSLKSFSIESLIFIFKSYKILEMDSPNDSDLRSLNEFCDGQCDFWSSSEVMVTPQKWIQMNKDWKKFNLTVIVDDVQKWGMKLVYWVCCRTLPFTKFEVVQK